MNTFNKFWQNFKTQPDIWFFYGFLLTCTLSIRKVLFFYPINGQFNEYTGIYLYLSDIFLILAVLAWVYSILYNNKFILSNIVAHTHARRFVVPRLPRRMFHVEHSYWGGTIFLLPLFLVIWSFISLIWADNKFSALFRSIKLAELSLLYLYIIYIVPRGTILKNTFRIIIGLGVAQSIIAIWQFIIQHSIGLTWLRESLISPDIAGVAKIILDGHKIIRSYGLFPHPNILGGFLLISILLTLAYSRMFHVEQSRNCHSERSGAKSKNLIRSFDRLGMTYILIQLLALILTFSKSAILGLSIAAFYIAIKNNVPRLPAGRQVEHILSQIKKMFHACLPAGRWNNFGRKLILSLGIILALCFVIRPDINSVLFKSLNERLFYLDVSRGTILAHPLIGVGTGQFVMEMTTNVPRPPRVDEQSSSRVEAGGTNIELWQCQPVHNVFLLIWSELGIIGLGLFAWWLWKLFHVEQKISKPDIKCSARSADGCEVYEPIKQEIVPRGTIMAQQNFLRILKGALLGFIFIMLFDHYLWDIQQGQLLLWITGGLIAGMTRKRFQAIGILR